MSIYDDTLETVMAIEGFDERKNVNLSIAASIPFKMLCVKVETMANMQCL